MINDSRIQKILYGGDYNPEQWPEDIWEEDMRLFKLASIDIVTLNVFSWAALQPSEDTYDFERLDRIMDLVEKNGLKVCLATSTAAHPAWMATRHPDILRVEYDGKKRKFGARHNSCPNSPTYRKYSVRLAEKLAERYGKRTSVVAWHVSNEYGGECYCENCEKAFRGWLREKYGTLDEVNRAWNTSFWSHTFYDWDEIVVPDLRSEHFWGERTNFQGISLDYRRFNSDSMLQCYELEAEAIRAQIPDAKITTNFMGTYKPLDYQKWAKSMDFVSWDSYPENSAPWSWNALCHDLMRSLKGGQPFALMEQTPSVSNWLSYCALKRPGVMRLWSYQAVAHGADTVMFFQMRRSIGACEKYHGAVIDHVGNENTRVFREVAALGAELKQLGSNTLGGRNHAKAAIYFDWDNWWALEYSAGPNTEFKYLDEVFLYYRALAEQNYAVDFVGTDDSLDGYEILIAPAFYMTKTGYDEKIRDFVRRGGTFITTFFSGIVDEHDLVITGGYPGRLRDILGIWVEEIDALPPETKNRITYEGTAYPAGLLCDILHSEGAEILSVYEKDFYAGSPALTVNRFGEGKAYYVATRLSDEFYSLFLRERMEEKGIRPILDVADAIRVRIKEGIPNAEDSCVESPVSGVAFNEPNGEDSGIMSNLSVISHNIEATERFANGKSVLYILNHGSEPMEVTMPSDRRDLLSGVLMRQGDRIVLEPKGVRILAAMS
ncbi:MAG: beta-galactosidase [Lachnospiraceae bacterium]|nr:beta-galactosidase [Lachnospiraceae bacterium]